MENFNDFGDSETTGPLIEIFGFPEDKIICMNCRNAVRLCEMHGVNYEFHNVIDDLVGGKFIRNPDVTIDLMKRLGLTSSDKISVPQIFVDGEHIGGLYDLKNYFK